MARALAFSPLVARGAWVPCGGVSPAREVSWWRSTLWTKDVSGMVPGSKDSALLHFGSRFPSSAPHTGQARFRASGAPIPAGSVPIFDVLITFRYGSLLLPVRFLSARNV